MHTLGMIPSPPDQRDYSLSKSINYAAAPIQNLIIPYVPEPINQGQYGMCVAVSLAGVIEAIEHKQRGVAVQVSPKYIYGNRGMSDVQGEGMMPREALQMATRFGVPRRDLLPGLSDYPTAKASITPVLDGEGIPNRIRGYVRLNGLQDIYDYFRLYGFPILFGMYVTESFMTTSQNGMVAAPTGALLGGHAMRGIGIRDNRLIVQNSWGSNFGDNWKLYIDLQQHQGIEAWGAIPEGSETLIQRSLEMLLTIDSNTAYVDGKAMTLDVPPTILNQRTMVPLRFISEALGAKVEWIGPLRKILIRFGGEQETL